MVRIIQLAAFFVLWMLFVSKLSAGELLAGIGAAVAAMFAFEVSKRAEPLRFQPTWRALAQAWRVPGLIVDGTRILMVELARRVIGRPRQSLFLLTPFRASGSDARSSAKRALAIIYATLPPNFLIVGIDRESSLMLYHQVRRDPVPEIIHRLESA